MAWSRQNTDLSFELVVADNSDPGAGFPQSLLDEILRSRVAFTYLPPSEEVLTMSENWERGVLAAKGSFVHVMGDDDAMLVIGERNWRKLQKAFESGAKIVGWPRNTVTYSWPEDRPAVATVSYPVWGFRKSLQFPSIPGLISNPNLYLFRNGIYNSFWSNDLINDVLDSRTLIFPYRSPDVISAVDSIKVNNFDQICLGFAVSINGASAKSNGISVMMGERDYGSPAEEFFRLSRSEIPADQTFADLYHLPSIGLCVGEALWMSFGETGLREYGVDLARLRQLAVHWAPSEHRKDAQSLSSLSSLSYRDCRLTIWRNAQAHARWLSNAEDVRIFAKSFLTEKFFRIVSAFFPSTATLFTLQKKIRLHVRTGFLNRLNRS